MPAKHDKDPHSAADYPLPQPSVFPPAPVCQLTRVPMCLVANWLCMLSLAVQSPLLPHRPGSSCCTPLLCATVCCTASAWAAVTDHCVVMMIVLRYCLCCIKQHVHDEQCCLRASVSSRSGDDCQTRSLFKYRSELWVTYRPRASNTHFIITRRCIVVINFRSFEGR
jgi:hypothetical protein